MFSFCDLTEKAAFESQQQLRALATELASEKSKYGELQRVHEHQSRQLHAKIDRLEQENDRFQQQLLTESENAELRSRQFQSQVQVKADTVLQLEVSGRKPSVYFSSQTVC
jgi:hypothetical protein